jgi:hypothetical protein
MSDGRSTRGGTRVIHLSRAAGLLFAIPVLLALGVATIVVFFVAVVAVFLAPLLRSDGHEVHDSHESPPEGGTVTLDRTAYRTMPGDVTDSEHDRAATPVTRMLPPGR